MKSTKSTISDGDCENIDDFPVQTQKRKRKFDRDRKKIYVKMCSNTHTLTHSHTKNGIKIFARNQYKEWISFYRSHKKTVSFSK